jgi:hypothetical protein
MITGEIVYWDDYREHPYRSYISDALTLEQAIEDILITQSERQYGYREGSTIIWFN